MLFVVSVRHMLQYRQKTQNDYFINWTCWRKYRLYFAIINSYTIWTLLYEYNFVIRLSMRFINNYRFVDFNHSSNKSYFHFQAINSLLEKMSSHHELIIHALSLSISLTQINYFFGFYFIFFIHLCIVYKVIVMLTKFE